MTVQVVNYEANDSTVVGFEIEPPPGFRPTGANELVGRVRDAIGPAVEAAQAVLERVKEARPDQVEVKFGVKVSGTVSWLVARTAAEGNFEVTLSWAPTVSDRRIRDAASTANPVGESDTDHT